MGGTAGDFIAEVISEAVDSKSKLALVPARFLEVLGCNTLDVPGPLQPYAVLIQDKLFHFAAARTKATVPMTRATFVQQVGRTGPAAGD